MFTSTLRSTDHFTLSLSVCQFSENKDANRDYEQTLAEHESPSFEDSQSPPESEGEMIPLQTNLC
jgi:hypothetical protein